MLKKNVTGVAAGAALGVLLTVLVYEGGGVKMSDRDAHVGLSPGEATSMGAGGIPRVQEWGTARTVASARVAQSPAPPAQHDESALRQAVNSDNSELKLSKAQKNELARRLGQAEAELSDGQEGRRGRSEFDLDREDWKTLAETSTVKFRVPCQYPADWTPSSNEIERLGLTPDDAELLRGAYARSNQRVWSKVRPLCVEAIGKEAVVDLLGTNTCIQVVLNLAKSADYASTRAAMQEVGLTRAHELAPPQEGVTKHPVFDLFWALSGETEEFQADLAESLGPEDAKRIAFSDATCSQGSSFSMGK
jgi:hypothetical protein